MFSVRLNHEVEEGERVTSNFSGQVKQGHSGCSLAGRQIRQMGPNEPHTMLGRL